LGNPSLPIVVIPHPFGSRKREEVSEMAKQCVTDIVRYVTGKSDE
jgi:predicted dienelactone hydrolase